MPDTLTVPDGTDVTVEHIDRLANGGARFELSAQDKRWRVDISRSGDVELVTAWQDGSLADLALPDWVDDVVAQIRAA